MSTPRFFTNSAISSIGSKTDRWIGPRITKKALAIELEAGSQSVYQWNPIGNLEKLSQSYEMMALRQTLIIHNVIIGPSAKQGDVNVISVESADYNTETVTFPMAYLTKGLEMQSFVDLTFPEHPFCNVKFTLSQGSGPVHLFGYEIMEMILLEKNDEPSCFIPDEDAIRQESSTWNLDFNEAEWSVEKKEKTVNLILQLTKAAVP